MLTAWQDTLLFGLGARLTALDPLKGTVRWEVPVAAPRGTNEVERLADLVGPAARVGNVYCIRAFQNGIGCVDAERVTALWSINVGGSQSLGADDDYVFAADASDRLSARLGYCIRAFQNGIGCVDAERVTALWSINVGGAPGHRRRRRLRVRRRRQRPPERAPPRQRRVACGSATSSRTAS